FEHLLLMIFPQVGNYLRVAMRNEAMAAAFELLFLFDIIEEFPVVNGRDRAVFVEQRLLAIGETDDAEAAVGQGNAIAFEIPVVVGSAVEQGVRHLSHDPWGNPLTTRKTNEARDSAHKVTLPKERSFMAPTVRLLRRS